VTEGIALIEDSNSWERNVCGLRVISLQVQFHEVAVLERLPTLVSCIQKHIRASGYFFTKQYNCPCSKLYNFKQNLF
jgi:hypothetical protein